MAAKTVNLAPPTSGSTSFWESTSRTLLARCRARWVPVCIGRRIPAKPRAAGVSFISHHRHCDVRYARAPDPSIQVQPHAAHEPLEAAGGFPLSFGTATEDPPGRKDVRQPS